MSLIYCAHTSIFCFCNQMINQHTLPLTQVLRLQLNHYNKKQLYKVKSEQ